MLMQASLTKYRGTHTEPRERERIVEGETEKAVPLRITTHCCRGWGGRRDSAGLRQNPPTTCVRLATQDRSTTQGPGAFVQTQDTCEMGADHGRLKGGRRFLSFLEHDGDNIVSNVALPFHLSGA